MKKIFFIYNNYEREHTIIELISHELEKRDVKTYLVGMTDKYVVKKLFQVRPDIIFTYPITTEVQIDVYTMAKVLFKCEIIAYTTEGLVDYKDDNALKLWAGPYDYSSSLVDYHLFWGKYLAKYLGLELYRQNKIIGKHQIKVFGNPMYEKTYENKYDNNLEIIKLQSDPRIKVLVLTGFHMGDYVLKDVINAKDVINTNGKTKEEILNDTVLKQWLQMIDEEKLYREKYIQHIIEAANEHPDVLFVVKLHPHEILDRKNKTNKQMYLKKLENIDNIEIIEESIPIGVLLPYFKLMVHYGSTASMEAYTYHVPTLKLEIRDINNPFSVEANRTTESTYYEDINEPNAISKYVVELKQNDSLFQTSKIMEKQLYGYMNYKDGQNYQPSKRIAEFLCSDLKYHKLNMSIGERIEFLIKFLKNIFLFDNSQYFII